MFSKSALFDHEVVSSCELLEHCAGVTFHKSVQQSVADSLLSSTTTVTSEESESGSESMGVSMISSTSDLAK